MNWIDCLLGMGLQPTRVGQRRVWKPLSLPARPQRFALRLGLAVLPAMLAALPRLVAAEALAAPVGSERLDPQASRAAWERAPIETVRAAAEKGEAVAQFWLGWRYVRGLGVARSRDEAERWMRSAADQGLVAAQYQMGLMAELEPTRPGQVVTGNYAVAAEWFQKAAAGDHPEAMLRLGDLYYYGKLGYNYAEAAKWFRRAAELGQRQAPGRLGNLYRDSHDDFPQDRAEAARWFGIAAKRGDVEAQYSLGELLLEDAGTPGDTGEAERWLEQAARNGHGGAAVKLQSLRPAYKGPANRPTLAQLVDAAGRGPWEAKVMLGQAYEEGWEGAPDYAAAARAYELALNHASPFLGGPAASKASESLERLVHLYRSGRLQPATDHELANPLGSYARFIVTAPFQFEVGEVYEQGKLVEPDMAAAVDWYTRAAKQGSPDAINRIGELWAGGLDGQPDPVEAAKWYRRAAGRGSAKAQLNLGRACLEGEGVGRDVMEAWAWFELAARQNQTQAVRLRTEAERQLTPEQLAEAHKRAAARSPAASEATGRTNVERKPIQTPAGRGH